MFNPGEVVYFRRQNGNRHFVDFGIVDMQYHDGYVNIDLLKLCETRWIVWKEKETDEKPQECFIDDFPPATRWYKLPKGWSYDTRLFDIENRIPEEFHGEWVNKRNPDDIKQAYDSGMLVKANKIFTGEINTEIDKHEGWRICKKYPTSFYDDPITVLVEAPRVYRSWDDAQQEVDAIEKEWQRQASLSDYDWSVELITREVDRWGYLYGKSKEEKDYVLKFILDLSNVEDIEIRIGTDRNIQWKYWKNKKWSSIETPF